MHKTGSSAPSISLILKKISDDKALILFNNIALIKNNSHTPAKGDEFKYKTILFTDFRIDLCRANKEKTRPVLSYCLGERRV